MLPGSYVICTLDNEQVKIRSSAANISNFIIHHAHNPGYRYNKIYTVCDENGNPIFETCCGFVTRILNDSYYHWITEEFFPVHILLQNDMATHKTREYITVKGVNHYDK